jgi:hypothetical protein
MASLQQHNVDCNRWLGAECEDVNRWMDEWFAMLGPAHRKVRHHWEGIHEAQQLFGLRGRRAAIIHVLRDCRHIPSRDDYETGAVDMLGLVADWPASAYVNYPEEVFSTLVEFALRGPTGKILWIFFRSKDDLSNLIAVSTHLTIEQRELAIAKWDVIEERFKQLPELGATTGAFRDADPAVSEYFSNVAHRNIFQMLSNQFKRVQPGMVRTAILINPLAIIDLQFVEELRPSLQGSDSVSAAKFAVPEALPMHVRAVPDPNMRRITLVSSQKTLSVMPIQVAQIPGVGMEVTFRVVATPQLIIVSRVGERYYLRSGVHRAYLLASLGQEEIPCLLVHEDEIPTIVGVYPAFNPSILAQPRPPLLIDALSSEFTLEVPLVRTQKVINISAEELVLPSD